MTIPCLSSLVLAASLALSGGAGDGTAAPPAAPPDAAPAPGMIGGRVIIVVSRTSEVAGTVEYEDADLVTIRGRDGEVRSFPKSRILRVVRLVDPEPGQVGVVRLRNGHLREGIIIEDTWDHVLVEIEGIRAKLDREHVDEVQLEPTFEERYRTFKAGIGGHADRHLALCRWLMDERRYELARDELVELLRADDLPEARRLLTIVNAQLELGAAPPRRTPETEEEPSNIILERFMVPDEILTHEDVNVIRVYEIDFRRPPKVYVDPETIRRLIVNHAAEPAIPENHTERMALFRAEPIDLVRLMFEVRATELYPEIQVITEPYALNLFRRHVHDTWLMHNCATSRCHGGPDAGRLYLHRRGYKDERVRYANLLTLERLRVDPEWRLVDYNKPMNSLIIQHGLRREIARKPHPEVDGWSPVFTKSTVRLLDRTLEWIESMMSTPRPEYPVEYEPPVPVPVVDAHAAPDPTRHDR